MSQNEMPKTEPEHYILSPGSEPLMERLLFNKRGLFLTILLALTVFLAYSMTKVGFDSRSSKYIPLGHEYIKNHINHASDLSSGLNNIKIVVASDHTLYLHG